MIGRLTVILVLLASAAHAQAPTSAIAGTVRDSTGGVVVDTRVVVLNQATADRRTTRTSARGTYRADQLPPGEYRLTVEARGFAPTSVTVTVSIGAVTTADLTLAPAGHVEPVSVRAASPTVDRERAGVDTLITASTIESLPLNGRSALDLVPLAPGLTAPIPGSNNRVFFSAIGAGPPSQPHIGDTRVTVDGFNLSSIDAIGSVLNLPPDALDAIHISTTNFDPVTGLTTSGAVNLVTRSGSNTPAAGLVGFIRDHTFAASPALTVDPANPDPYFRRWQFGGSAGGPVVHNRLFVFGDLERTDQQGVVSVELPAPFTALGGIVPSPFTQTLSTVKVDARLTDRAHLSFESIVDRNTGLAPVGGEAVTTTLPSNWANLTNAVSLTGLTLSTVLSPTAVNEARVAVFRLSSLENPASAADCAGIGSSCLGLGGPTVQVVDAPRGVPLLTLGPSRTLSFVGHREEVADTFTWQRDRHRVRLGVDYEHNVSAAVSDDRDPASLALFSPASAAMNGQLTPSAFTTAADILSLPLQSVQTSVGSGATVERGFQPYHITDGTRLFAADAWQLTPRSTAEASLGWSYEPNALNSDLSKPAWLAPLVGAANLGPVMTHPQWAPSTGLTWAATADGHTVLRLAAGRFVDPETSTNLVSLESERMALLPVGLGRIAGPVPINRLTGAPLSFTRPSALTGADLMAELPAIRADLAGDLKPGNRDFSVPNIDALKTASDLTDPAFGQPTAIHVNAGLERQLRSGLLAGVDGIWRRFDHTALAGIDLNRWNSANGPVIGSCTSPESLNLAAVCSNGPITFDTTDGHARNLGLLVHVDDTHLGWLEYHLAYALSSYTGTNGTGTSPNPTLSVGTGFSNYDWTANDGPLPTDRRHVLNLSGLVRLPAHFDLAFNLAVASPEPFSAYLGGIDLDGDGTVNDLLPGSTVGAFGRSLGKADLIRLVTLYNQQLAGTAPFKTTLPTITLPASFSFGATFATLDVRLTRTFGGRPHGLRVALMAEVFNLLNRRNYTGYDANLLSPTFGQPTGLVSQVFGAGGPRAGQCGVRITF